MGDLLTSQREAVTLACGCTEGEACHTVCCHDDDLGMCGADLTGVPWCNDEDNCQAPQCVVCEQLYATEQAMPSDEPCECACCLDVPQEAS